MSTTMFFNALTSKQKKVYSAIESYIKSNGIPPTVREIGEMVGEKTPGAVQGILNRLEQKGVIKRQMGMARSIQLVAEEAILYMPHAYIPEIKKISRRIVDDLLNIYNISGYMPVPADFIPSGGTCFSMKCTDGSMEKSGLKPGDILVFTLNAALRDEDIALALYDNHVLIRRYFSGSGNGRILLKADDDLIGKEEFEENEITMIGRLAAKLSLY